MKKVSLFTIFCLFISLSSYSQYFEAGVLLGSSNYFGDISPKGPSPSEYNLAFGLMARYNINKHVAFKANIFKGSLTGDDKNNTVSSGLRSRNLSFRTNIVEFAITNEFNITPFEIRAGKTSVPYVFAGIAGFYFNPQAQFKGSWYDLQPLGTEGQERLNTSMKKYSRISIAIPFGFGIKMNVHDKVNLGIEMGVRKTITDYIDDVSARYPDIDQFKSVDPLAATLSFREPEFYRQAMDNPEGDFRGNPNDQDWYFIGGLTVTINLTDRQGLEWDPKYKKFEALDR